MFVVINICAAQVGDIITINASQCRCLWPLASNLNAHERRSPSNYHEYSCQNVRQSCSSRVDLWLAPLGARLNGRNETPKERNGFDDNCDRKTATPLGSIPALLTLRTKYIVEHLICSVRSSQTVVDLYVWPYTQTHFCNNRFFLFQWLLNC